MKKVILAFAFTATLLTSCNDKKTEVAPANDTVKANDSMSKDSTVVDSTLLDTTKTK
jgi:hypothetical protein